MTTPEINENCHYMQNDPPRCKIKREKFHFDILCCYGVVDPVLPGRRGCFAPPLRFFAHNSERKKDNSTKFGDFPENVQKFVKKLKFEY